MGGAEVKRRKPKKSLPHKLSVKCRANNKLVVQVNVLLWRPDRWPLISDLMARKIKFDSTPSASLVAGELIGL